VCVDVGVWGLTDRYKWRVRRGVNTSLTKRFAETNNNLRTSPPSLHVAMLSMEERERREVTPRNSNEDVVEDWPMAKEPTLSSDLAREIAMALDWEPTLCSELALQCEKAVAWEPTLSSDLGREIAMALDWEPTLYSDLALQCEKAVAWEPQLTSELAREISLSLDWEPTLSSELALRCEKAVGRELAPRSRKTEALEPRLQSDLAKSCALLVALRLKSELAVTCARALHAETVAGASSNDEAESGDEAESEDEPSDAESEQGDIIVAAAAQYASQHKQPAAATEFSRAGGMGSKPTSRESTQLARKCLSFA
jgi:hypothetical protein